MVLRMVIRTIQMTLDDDLVKSVDRLVSRTRCPGSGVTGLELGAHDYITEPFSPRILVAGVRAAL